jgi:RNA polymerase sigma-70 factor (ECF subfamily)
MTVTKPTDIELLRAMMGGDPDALAALYGRRHNGVYRFALQMSGSPALAEDVTQEVFMVLIRGGCSYDEARGSVNGFLLGIARNHVLRRLERERTFVLAGQNDDEDLAASHGLVVETGPLDDLTRNETIESVRRAVLSLPPRYREVVVLCELQEMSYAETAEVLNCAVGTIRSRLHRARALLIEKLRPAPESNLAAANAAPERCFA